MTTDKKTLQTLKRYAQVFREARIRDANESETVMLLTEFFKEVLEFDPLKGEVSKEVAIKDRYCDIALKLDGEIELLIEAKAVGHKVLSPKHIEQAENYASRSGITWVMLTNGIQWQLYHISFAEGEGITSDLAFDVSLEESSLEEFWTKVSMLTKKSVRNEELESFWGQKKALKPSVIVKALFSQEVLSVLRRELNRQATARLDLDDVFDSVKVVVSKDALLEAGDIAMSKKKRKKRKSKAAHSEVNQNEESNKAVDVQTGNKDAA